MAMKDEMKKFCQKLVTSLRPFGIEMTPEEAENMVRETLKEAIRELYKEEWKEIIRLARGL
jgi:uncharacterized protein YqfB (UPF0267 family)